MSILIRGMEMPKNCKKCMFADFDDVEFDYELYCAISKKYADLDACDHPLGWICSLTEVKEPHGDLVDKDKLIQEFMDSDLDHLQRDDWKEVIQIVSDADVIIEAEEKEE